MEFPLDARDGSPRACNGSGERDQAAKNDAFSSKEFATYICNIFTLSHILPSLSTRSSLPTMLGRVPNKPASGASIHSYSRAHCQPGIDESRNLSGKLQASAHATYREEARGR